MTKVFQVENVKCGGCANTLINGLKEEFGDVFVNLDKFPREITVDINENDEEKLKLKLRSLGYPLSSDDLSGLEKATTTAKSFVSCAIGKFNVATNK